MQRSRFVCLFLVVALSGCSSSISRTPAPTTASLPAIQAADLRGARVFNVDPNASDVQIHVFRGGTLARLGHNHVMTSKHVTGRVWLHPAIERSGLELQFPVSELIVDDAAARAAAGTDFPGEIPSDDREGTKKNMLRTEVLDAEHYPDIQLRSVRIAGSQLNPQVLARITIKGVSRDVSVPALVSVAGSRLTATGAFDIQQTDFGIKPFSIGMGALEVVDRLHIQFKIVAAET